MVMGEISGLNLKRGGYVFVCVGGEGGGGVIEGYTHLPPEVYSGRTRGDTEWRE